MMLSVPSARRSAHQPQARPAGSWRTPSSTTAVASIFPDIRPRGLRVSASGPLGIPDEPSPCWDLALSQGETAVDAAELVSAGERVVSLTASG